MRTRLAPTGIAFCLFTSLAAHAQTLTDSSLRVNRYVRGFDNPTGVAFLDSNGTALVTEKNTGRVRLVENRTITATVLDLPVANDNERGLLSIALSPSFATDHFVYLYHTTADSDGGAAIANEISRYTWNPGTKRLTLERNLLDLGSNENHNGGKLMFAPNGKLFAVIGDLFRQERTQNFENSGTTSLSSVIVRIQPNGRDIASNPFPSQPKVWAYGVRNSFGLAFDPVTGDLWDTENGPESMDEINRVTPGFNSGWRDIMGPRSRNGGQTGTLVSLGSRANYQDPKMTWVQTVAPTDLEFINSSRLGSAYRNDMIVGDVKTGSLYHFDLTSNRKSLRLGGVLADGVADNTGGLLDESDQLIFGGGFGVTTDLINGPGGLFVLSLSNGALYRISQQTTTRGFGRLDTRAVPEPSPVVGGLVAMIFVLRRKH